MTNKITAHPFTFSRTVDGKKITMVQHITDDARIWQTRVILVLGTRPGERIMRPDFGCNLYTAVFEPQSVAEQIISTSITEAFTKWLPDLSLKQISPTFDDTTNTFTVNILYGLPNAEVDSVTINSGIFNRSGELIQEITNV